MPRMKLEEFLDMVAEERVDILVAREKPEKEREMLNAAEEAIKRLSIEDQKTLTKCQNLLMDLDARDIRRAYMGGMHDGIRLAGYVYQEGMEGKLEIENWHKVFQE